MSLLLKPPKTNLKVSCCRGVSSARVSWEKYDFPRQVFKQARELFHNSYPNDNELNDDEIKEALDFVLDSCELTEAAPLTQEASCEFPA